MVLLAGQDLNEWCLHDAVYVAACASHRCAVSPSFRLNAENACGGSLSDVTFVVSKASSHNNLLGHRKAYIHSATSLVLGKLPTMPLLACGSNAHGQLGINSTTDVHTPTQCEIALPAFTHPISISGGANHTIIITSSRELFAAGHNESGQLGLDGGDRHVFTPIPWSRDERGVPVLAACGWDHTVVLNAEGRVWGFGNNVYGQLGLGPDVAKTHEAVEIPLPEGSGEIVRIACGMRFTVFLDEAGKVYACGANKAGELLPLRAEAELDVVFNVRPLVLPPCRDVACGQYHVVFAEEDRGILSQGRNRHGQLGPADGLLSGDSAEEGSTSRRRSSRFCRFDEDRAKDCSELFSGWNFSGYVSQSKRLILWGRNNFGQLGIGTIDDNQPPTQSPIEDVMQIACGAEHTVALTANGQCFIWGWNEHGNCGLGHTTDVHTPTEIPYSGGNVRIVGCGYGHTLLYTDG
ncbi:regulator of chromosome condensation 1/beta-lactamase-inhibitor protein II [Fimicolochytrium jonesii]|uniref:regulator of chromosome condensation 1/beta-lactamase-inhibitor protein II n=1 Tax=Fimicolochytrium jonesii TaxID=1396493 RepID=UPI0022FF3182|nr:regulator of chromosome condensation 1/beta-lactamase-inhibitor protein II [Fimicolochytrium jonesii]KAI8818407.1 regulator of chromosome condensation 1/beta-lactamase-inhibitor protein II [Fimicolochytrium jonesii]